MPKLTPEEREKRRHLREMYAEIRHRIDQEIREANFKALIEQKRASSRERLASRELLERQRKLLQRAERLDAERSYAPLRFAWPGNLYQVRDEEVIPKTSRVLRPDENGMAIPNGGFAELIVRSEQTWAGYTPCHMMRPRYERGRWRRAKPGMDFIEGGGRD